MKESKIMGWERFGLSTFMVFVMPFFIKWLWRICIVPITELDVITYWQAFGLQFFVSFLLSYHMSDIWMFLKQAEGRDIE